MPVLLSEKPLQQDPTTRQTPSGLWPQRACRTMGEKLPMQSMSRCPLTPGASAPARAAAAAQSPAMHIAWGRVLGADMRESLGPGCNSQFLRPTGFA